MNETKNDVFIFNLASESKEREKSHIQDKAGEVILKLKMMYSFLVGLAYKVERNNL